MKASGYILCKSVAAEQCSVLRRDSDNQSKNMCGRDDMDGTGKGKGKGKGKGREGEKRSWMEPVVY